MFLKSILTVGMNMKLEILFNSPMFKRLFLSLLLIFLASSTIQPVSAQSAGPVYIVQAGDTLSYIASRFNVSLADLIAANPEINPNVLNQGQQIVIPGLEGVTGILETEVIEFGDSLRNLSRRTQVSDAQLIKLNRLVSPTELYVGSNLIVPINEGQTQLKSRMSPGAGETLLELAVKQGSNPWSLASLNKLSGSWAALPNDILYSPAGDDTGANGLPSAFISASVTPLPMVQGATEVVRVQLQDGYTASGMLVDHQLNFFPESGTQVAIQGVHALLEPGVYPLRLEASLPDGSRQSLSRWYSLLPAIITARKSMCLLKRSILRQQFQRTTKSTTLQVSLLAQSYGTLFLRHHLSTLINTRLCMEQDVSITVSAPTWWWRAFTPAWISPEVKVCRSLPQHRDESYMPAR
jgi:LysM repeat protein